MFGIDDAIVGLINTVVGRIWPDKSEEGKAKLELAKAQMAETLAELTASKEIDLAQLAIDVEDAKSDSFFKSGVRPLVMWICAFGMAWQFIVQPMVVFIASCFHYVIPIPQFDTTTMVSMLMGMLGLGTLRTLDKRNK